MKIAVLICSLVFDSQKAFMKGIERKVRDYKDVCSVFCCHVNVASNEAYLKGEYSIFDLPDLSSFDGIVFVKNTFTNTEYREKLTKQISELGIPCVCIDDYSPEFVNILSDEKKMTGEITKHLITAHSCKKIYFLGGVEASNDTKTRFEGFKEALDSYGLEFKDEWYVNGNFEYTSGVVAATEFMRVRDGLPDAIVCCNDEMAIGLISELKRLGVKVPKDVKVTGIDYDSVSRVFVPRITTMKRQQYQKGTDAVDFLHEFDKHEKGEKNYLEISMFCGESCGCKPTEEVKSDVTTNNMLAVDRYFQSELTQTVKYMTANLMGRKNNASLLEGVAEYAERLSADELYLCLNVRPEYNIDYSDYSAALALIDRDNQEDYSDKMLAAVTAYGKDVEISEDKFFDRKQLFPSSEVIGRNGGTYYFLPIHYMNRNFGYAILGTSGDLIRNDFFPNFCSITSNAFENTRKRDVMVQMISTLDKMWIYDTLTGIYNRAGFFKLSENIVDQCIKNQQPLCVIFLDVDGLKEVNDVHGHDEGDNLIKGVANVLKNIKRHGEILMRYGGDEFVLLAPNYTVVEADEAVERIEKMMIDFNEKSEKPYSLEASVGYCITTLNSKDELNKLIEEADHEMYKKKYVKKALKRREAR